MLGCRVPEFSQCDVFRQSKASFTLTEKTIHRLTTIVFLAAEFYKYLKTVGPLTARSISTNSFILYTMFCLFLGGGCVSQMDTVMSSAAF